jgi:carotenoid cleavage dioxygenase-like enzyme
VSPTLVPAIVVHAGTRPSEGSTLLANLWLKNVANTAVLFWGGRLLALWEASQPYRLDPRTLETLGVDTLNDLLQEGLPFATGSRTLDGAARLAGAPVGGDAFSAHPRHDPATGRLLTYTYQIVPSLFSDRHVCVRALSLSQCSLRNPDVVVRVVLRSS